MENHLFLLGEISLLFFVLKLKIIDFAMFLIDDKKININHVNNNGECALSIAHSYKLFDIVKKIVIHNDFIMRNVELYNLCCTSESYYTIPKHLIDSCGGSLNPIENLIMYILERGKHEPINYHLSDKRTLFKAAHDNKM